MLSAFLEVVANAVATVLTGWIPERQPWRAVVVGLYVVGVLAAAAVLGWAVATAL